MIEILLQLIHLFITSIYVVFSCRTLVEASDA